MSDNENPFLEMAKAISCLRLELPESVWKDVADRWMEVVKAINTPSPVPDKVEDAVILLQKQIDRLEVHDEMLLNTICQDLKKAVKILKTV